MKQPEQKAESKQRRSYDKTFKEEALAMWANSSKSAIVIAEELVRGLRVLTGTGSIGCMAHIR